MARADTNPVGDSRPLMASQALPLVFVTYTRSSPYSSSSKYRFSELLKNLVGLMTRTGSTGERSDRAIPPLLVRSVGVKLSPPSVEISGIRVISLLYRFSCQRRETVGGAVGLW